MRDSVIRLSIKLEYQFQNLKNTFLFFLGNYRLVNFLVFDHIKNQMRLRVND